MYYTATLKKYPPVCFYCGMAEGFVTEGIVELQRQYAVVRPLCFLCQSEGKTHKVGRPNNVIKRQRSVRCVIIFMFFSFFFFFYYRPHFIICLPEKQLIKFEWPSLATSVMRSNLKTRKRRRLPQKITRVPEEGSRQSRRLTYVHSSGGIKRQCTVGEC